MFYCDDCAKKNEWPAPDFGPRSRGPCELCKNVRVCYDVPSYALPMPKRRS